MPPARPQNRVLAALPEEDFLRLVPHLVVEPHEIKDIVYDQGAPIGDVYFPTAGLISITTLLADGATVEAATVGDEGLVGIEALFSAQPVSNGEVMFQIAGEAARLPLARFREEIDRHGALFESLGRYAQYVIAQMMQSAACNARHQVQERCARWLLMTHDRVHRDEFYLSHEFLATMLGVRRQSVTVVAGTLQGAGLIRYTRGHVNILDRASLEAASCECYGLIRRRYDALT
jgi:CRP-like cAMP-binding protein